MINNESLLQHFGGDLDLVKELAELFEQTYPKELSELEFSIQKKDFQNIELHAHTLKGMIANFFDLDLTEKASQIETLGRSKSELDLDEKFKQFSSALKEFVSDLKKIGS